MTQHESIEFHHNESISAEEYLALNYEKYRNSLLIVALSRTLLVAAFAVLLYSKLYSREDIFGATAVVTLFVIYSQIEYFALMFQIRKVHKSISNLFGVDISEYIDGMRK